MSRTRSEPAGGADAVDRIRGGPSDRTLVSTRLGVQHDATVHASILGTRRPTGPISGVELGLPTTGAVGACQDSDALASGASAASADVAAVRVPRQDVSVGGNFITPQRRTVGRIGSALVERSGLRAEGW